MTARRIAPGFRTVAMPDGPAPVPLTPDQAASRLAEFIDRYPRLLVLTGAGISTQSGIPDYRDGDGGWKRRPPVQHQEFMNHPAIRQRYWARSLIGWPVMRNSQPNGAHQRLALLEAQGSVPMVVTQNVDRLHQRAGSRNVIDLHGRADEARCMACDFRTQRDEVHERCYQLNPAFRGLKASAAPDGDADLEAEFDHFVLWDCPRCGGILKPDVVFFGDNVPKDRVATALDQLQSSDGLLVIGSSLMVFSGFRFCRYAQQWQKPIATLNLGRTRADSLVDLRLNADIVATLSGLDRM
ncbi:MAG: NAD-dependent protein deacetylase [Saccharospirillum sp.]